MDSNRVRMRFTRTDGTLRIFDFANVGTFQKWLLFGCPFQLTVADKNALLVQDRDADVILEGGTLQMVAPPSGAEQWEEYLYLRPFLQSSGIHWTYGGGDASKGHGYWLWEDGASLTNDGLASGNEYFFPYGDVRAMMEERTPPIPEDNPVHLSLEEAFEVIADKLAAARTSLERGSLLHAQRLLQEATAIYSPNILTFETLSGIEFLQTAFTNTRLAILRAEGKEAKNV